MSIAIKKGKLYLSQPSTIAEFEKNNPGSKVHGSHKKSAKGYAVQEVAPETAVLWYDKAAFESSFRELTDHEKAALKTELSK